MSSTYSNKSSVNNVLCCIDRSNLFVLKPSIYTLFEHFIIKRLNSRCTKATVASYSPVTSTTNGIGKKNSTMYSTIYLIKVSVPFRYGVEASAVDSWFTAPPWKVQELETLKSRLNFHKSQLNDFDIEEWSSHTRRRNPAGEVCWKIRCLVNPEFLTQAWTKFYECACSYNIIPDEAVSEGKMVSLHLCEAPGAFITSLNHYLKLNYEHIEVSLLFLQDFI